MRGYLKKLRKQNNFTQSDVSEKLGVGLSTYTMVENGERQKDLSLSWVKKLSEVFNVTVDYIMDQEAKIREGRL